MEEKMLGFVMETISNFKITEKRLNTHQDVLMNHKQYIVRANSDIQTLGFVCIVGFSLTYFAYRGLKNQINNLKEAAGSVDVTTETTVNMETTTEE